MIFKILFLIGFISICFYIGGFLRFALRFRKLFPVLWGEIGYPEIFGIIGQRTYLMVIFGLYDNIPIASLKALWWEVVLVRATLPMAIFGMVGAAIAAG